MRAARKGIAADGQKGFWQNQTAQPAAVQKGSVPDLLEPLRQKQLSKPGAVKAVALQALHRAFKTQLFQSLAAVKGVDPDSFNFPAKFNGCQRPAVPERAILNAPYRSETCHSSELKAIFKQLL